MANQAICDKAIQILRATHDGNSLARDSLFLVQLAVNGHLNSNGIEAFESLYASIFRPASEPTT